MYHPVHARNGADVIDDTPKPWEVEPAEETPRRAMIRRMLAEAAGDDEATKDVLRWIQETGASTAMPGRAAA